MGGLVVGWGGSVVVPTRGPGSPRSPLAPGSPAPGSPCRGKARSCPRPSCPWPQLCCVPPPPCQGTSCDPPVLPQEPGTGQVPTCHRPERAQHHPRRGLRPHIPRAIGPSPVSPCHPSGQRPQVCPKREERVSEPREGGARAQPPRLGQDGTRDRSCPLPGGTTVLEPPLLTAGPGGPRGPGGPAAPSLPGKPISPWWGHGAERAGTGAGTGTGAAETPLGLPEAAPSARPGAGRCRYPLSWGTWRARLPAVPSQARLSRCPGDAR